MVGSSGTTSSRVRYATGQPLTSGWIRKSFYRLLDDIGLPRLPLHGLWHTMATLMLAAAEHPKW